MAAVVGETMWTLTDSPAASVAGPKLSTPLAIDQPAGVPSIDQLRPAFFGSVSVTVTPVAEPVPAFVTVIVKPIWSPAFTVALSATLVI